MRGRENGKTVEERTSRVSRKKKIEEMKRQKQFKGRKRRAGKGK